MSADQQELIGLRPGAKYWEVELKLAHEGYHCYVAGVKRENFACTKTAGFFPSCVLGVNFDVNEKNEIENINILKPGCIGMP
jgi:hypothetical protein